MRRREIRWRKGFEESQRVALCNEGREHGSFEVGILRDCKALSCFGSSVECEEDEDEGGEGGEGDEVGEGVGERVMEREAMVMGRRRRKMRRNDGGDSGCNGGMAWFVQQRVGESEEEDEVWI